MSLKDLAIKVLERDKALDTGETKPEKGCLTPAEKIEPCETAFEQPESEQFLTVICSQGRVHIIRADYRDRLCEACGRCEFEKQIRRRRPKQ
ncbi:MAG: hypothetical protein ABIH23_32125 [bacterium]